MQYFDYGRAKRQFARSHPGSLRWRQLAPPLLTLLLLAALIVSVWIPLALLLPTGYLVGLLVVGFSSRAGAWRVASALATMHLSWGWGFLSSIRR